MEIKIEPYVRIHIYSHFFKVEPLIPRSLGIILSFCNKYIHYGITERLGVKERTPIRTFAYATHDNREFRFQIGQLEEFKIHLRNYYIDESYWQVHFEPMYTPDPIKVKFTKDRILYDYQQEAKEFIMKRLPDDLNSRLATMPTGSGKGSLAINVVAEYATRILITVLPKYVTKWQEEIEQLTDVDPKDIMSVQGSGQVRGIIELAQEKRLKAKFIVLSLKTIQNFFKEYEKDRFSDEFKSYGCLPEDFCKILGIGNIIIDEIHEHFGAVHKFMCYTHVPNIIGLTGTLLSDDIFVQKMHQLMFPREIRFDKIKMDKYIKVYAIRYEFQFWHEVKQKIRTTEYGSNNYSQIAFEKSIMKNPRWLENYLKLIDYFIFYGFTQSYQKGDKLAVYAASIAMCNHITEYLKKKYSHLDVRRYVEDDPYENVIDADVRVTTILSAGTAVDMPNLTVVLMTNNVFSQVSNLQSLGRLRKIHGRDTKFIYLYCGQIKKHVDYSNNRKMLFQDRVASFKDLVSPISI